jgi:ankyrin repeat protein
MKMAMAVLILMLLAQAGALNWAVRKGDQTLTRALLTVGANPSAPDFAGNRPLAYAVLNDRADLAALLLDYKADVRTAPLGAAVNVGSLPLVKLFLDRGADATAVYPDGKTLLHIASAAGRTEIVKLLLEKGADPNARDADGSSPLDEAAWGGHRDVVAVLLESGAKVNSPQAKTGATPLNEAAFKGREAVVKLLLAKNADVTIKDNAGFSPLRNAIRFDHPDVAQTLINRGARPGDSYSSMLEEAVLKGQRDTVEVLLSQGVDVNVRFPSGSAPLHDAALKGHDAVVNLLLAKGADVSERDAAGATPLYAAALNGNLSTVTILLAHGADINAQETESGNTSLYAAASLGREDVVDLLLANGADPNLCNKTGASPLHAALENGFDVIAAKIRAKGGRDLR